MTAVYDGTNIQVFLNGKADSATQASGSIASDSNNVLIGSYLTSSVAANFFHGNIDEVKIFNQALTSAQIAANYNARSNPEGVSQQQGNNTQNMPAALSNGLVGYWKEDEASDANAIDSSGNATTLTDANGVTRTNGKFLNGGDFERGNGEYQYAADNTVLSITGALTLSVWIKPESVTASTNFNIMGKWDGSNQSYLLTQYGDEIFMHIDAAASSVGTSASNLVAGTWYHVVGVYDPSTTSGKIYINGVLAATSTSMPASIGDDAGRFQIGIADSSTTPVNAYDGIIDESRIYNRALSAAEISQLYNWAPGPVGYWKFDENSSTTTYDSSGNGFNGTFSAANTSFAPGKYGSAISKSGSGAGSSISYSAGSSLDLTSTSTVSVGFWLKSSTSHTSRIIEVPAAGGLGIEYIGTSLRLASFGGNVVASTAIQFDGLWHHYEATYDGTTAYFYRDGAAVTAGQAFTGNWSSGSNTLNLGGDSSYPLNGSLDDVKIYRYARTAAQVVEDMNAGHPAPGSPVSTAVGYWKLDEGYGTTANNSGSGASLGSTITGSPAWTQSGKFGKALDFDGTTNQYVTMSGSGTALQEVTDNSFTWTTWVNPDAVPANTNNSNAFSAFVARAGFHTFLGYTPSQQFVFNVYNTSNTAFSATTTKTFAPGTWHHLAGVINTNDNIVRLYVDGIQLATSTLTGTLRDYTTASYYMGKVGTSACTVDYTWCLDGKVDEVKIYNSALTADQVKADMNRGAAQVLGAATQHSSALPTSYSNLGLWLKADAITGVSDGAAVSSWTDSSSAANNATQATGSQQPTLQNSELNGYPIVRFDGDDFFSMANNLTTIRTVFIVSKWNDVITDYLPILGHSTSFDFHGSGSGCSTATTLLFGSSACTSTNVLNGSAYSNGISSSPSSLTRNTSYHILTLATTGNTSFNQLSKDRGLARYFKGDMAEVIIYTSTLDDSQRGSIEKYLADKYAFTYGPGTNTSASAEYCVPGANVYCNSPVGRWDIEEGTGTTLNDSSGNAHSATLVDTQSWVPGKIGKGVKGTSNRITMTPPATAGKTIEFWTYRDSAASIMYLFDDRNSADVDANNYLYWNTDGTFTNNLSSVIYVDGKVATSATSGTWHHIAVTALTLDTSGTLRFGSNWNNAFIYNGRFDNIRIFDYNRTAAQIAWDYNKGGPVGWWKMDECQGTTINDSSGNAITGTLTVGAGGSYSSAGTCSTASTAWGAGAAGKRNYALGIGGADDYVDLGSPTALQNQTFAYAAWVKRANTTGAQAIFGYSSGGNTGGPVFYFNSSSQLELAKTGTAVCTSSRTVTDTSGWHHVAVTYDGANCKFYIDGLLDNSPSFVQTFSFSNNALIGAHTTSSTLINALLDDIRAYNYPLTPTQIKSVYTDGALRYGPTTGAP